MDGPAVKSAVIFWCRVASFPTKNGQPVVWLVKYRWIVKVDWGVPSYCHYLDFVAPPFCDCL